MEECLIKERKERSNKGRSVGRSWSLWEKVVLLSCIADNDDENEKEDTKFLQLIWTPTQPNQPQQNPSIPPN